MELYDLNLGFITAQQIPLVIKARDTRKRVT